MKKISKSVYAETKYQGCNPGFVVTKEGVVMVDTPQMPGDALKWRDIIAKHGRVKYLINTEPHGDHYTGNYFFKTTVIAHEGTRQAILSADLNQLLARIRQMAPQEADLLKRYKLRLPSVTLTQEMKLYLGDHTFHLINMPGHTPYQVAVYIPEEKVIFTSDNIFYRTAPFLHQALPYEWIASLQKMEKMDIKAVVPGHGEICDAACFAEMRSCIEEWVDTISQAKEKGWEMAEALKRVTLLDRYSLAPEMHTMLLQFNVGRLYQVLK